MVGCLQTPLRSATSAASARIDRPAWGPGPAEIAAAGGADRRFARTAGSADWSATTATRSGPSTAGRARRMLGSRRVDTTGTPWVTTLSRGPGRRGRPRSAPPPRPGRPARAGPPTRSAPAYPAPSSTSLWVGPLRGWPGGPADHQMGVDEDVTRGDACVALQPFDDRLHGQPGHLSGVLCDSRGGGSGDDLGKSTAIADQVLSADRTPSMPALSPRPPTTATGSRAPSTFGCAASALRGVRPGSRPCESPGKLASPGWSVGDLVGAPTR